MPEGTIPFQHDRAMSFCRVAYDCPTFEVWQETARRRGLTGSNVWDFWRTAVAARRAGMAKELAFPLTHELEQKGLHVKESKIVPATAPSNKELGGVNQSTCQHRWAFNRFGGYDYWCQDCLLPGRLETSSQAVSAAEALASVLIGETVVTNDRVLNYVLTHAGEIIGRRDIAPLEKFETLYAYLLKARREVLGAVET